VYPEHLTTNVTAIGQPSQWQSQLINFGAFTCLTAKANLVRKERHEYGNNGWMARSEHAKRDEGEGRVVDSTSFYLGTAVRLGVNVSGREDSFPGVYLGERNIGPLMT